MSKLFKLTVMTDKIKSRINRVLCSSPQSFGLLVIPQSLSVLICYHFNKLFHCVFKMFADFAFPNDDDVPTLFLKLSGNFCKTLFIVFDFVFPKFDVVFGNTRVFAVFVSVPETTVNENDCFEFFQYDIRFSG